MSQAYRKRKEISQMKFKKIVYKTVVTIMALILIIYLTAGVIVDDVFFKSKVGASIHFHGDAAIIIYIILVSFICYGYYKLI